MGKSIGNQLSSISSNKISFTHDLNLYWIFFIWVVMPSGRDET